MTLADTLLQLADRFESRAIWLLQKPGGQIVDEANGLWMLYSDVAHIADCFTIAAALRAQAANGDGR